METTDTEYTCMPDTGCKPHHRQDKGYVEDRLDDLEKRLKDLEKCLDDVIVDRRRGGS